MMVLAFISSNYLPTFGKEWLKRNGWLASRMGRIMQWDKNV